MGVLHDTYIFRRAYTRNNAVESAALSVRFWRDQAYDEGAHHVMVDMSRHGRAAEVQKAGAY